MGVELRKNTENRKQDAAGAEMMAIGARDEDHDQDQEIESHGERAIPGETDLGNEGIGMRTGLDRGHHAEDDQTAESADETTSGGMIGRRITASAMIDHHEILTQGTGRITRIRVMTGAAAIGQTTIEFVFAHHVIWFTPFFCSVRAIDYSRNSYTPKVVHVS